MSRFLDRLVTLLFIGGMFLSFLTYHDDAEYDIPYKELIFKITAVVLLFVILLRMVIRWSFVIKPAKTTQFKTITYIGRIYLNKLKVLFGIRVLIFATCGFILWIFVPQAILFVGVIVLNVSDEALFLIRAISGNGLYVGLGKNGVVKCTHQPALVNFHGLKQVMNETTSVQFLFKNGKTFSLPFEYLHNRVEFLSELKSLMREKGVYYKE